MFIDFLQTLSNQWRQYGAQKVKESVDAIYPNDVERLEQEIIKMQQFIDNDPDSKSFKASYNSSFNNSSCLNSGKIENIAWFYRFILLFPSIKFVLWENISNTSDLPSLHGNGHWCTYKFYSGFASNHKKDNTANFNLNCYLPVNYWNEFFEQLKTDSKKSKKQQINWPQNDTIDHYVFDPQSNRYAGAYIADIGGHPIIDPFLSRLDNCEKSFGRFIEELRNNTTDNGPEIINLCSESQPQPQPQPSTAIARNTELEPEVLAMIQQLRGEPDTQEDMSDNNYNENTEIVMYSSQVDTQQDDVAEMDDDLPDENKETLKENVEARKLQIKAVNSIMQMLTSSVSNGVSDDHSENNILNGNFAADNNFSEIILHSSQVNTNPNMIISKQTVGYGTDPIMYSPQSKNFEDFFENCKDRIFQCIEMSSKAEEVVTILFRQCFLASFEKDEGVNLFNMTLTERLLYMGANVKQTLDDKNKSINNTTRLKTNITQSIERYIWKTIRQTILFCYCVKQILNINLKDDIFSIDSDYKDEEREEMEKNNAFITKELEGFPRFKEYLENADYVNDELNHLIQTAGKSSTTHKLRTKITTEQIEEICNNDSGSFLDIVYALARLTNWELNKHSNGNQKQNIAETTITISRTETDTTTTTNVTHVKKKNKHKDGYEQIKWSYGRPMMKQITNIASTSNKRATLILSDEEEEEDEDEEADTAAVATATTTNNEATVSTDATAAATIGTTAPANSTTSIEEHRIILGKRPFQNNSYAPQQEHAKKHKALHDLNDLIFTELMKSKVFHLESMSQDTTEQTIEHVKHLISSAVTKFIIDDTETTNTTTASSAADSSNLHESDLKTRYITMRKELEEERLRNIELQKENEAMRAKLNSTKQS